MLINTSRGAVVDQDALVDELRSGRFDAVIDVTHPEVLDPDHVLYDLPNVFLTPHIAGSMGLELRRMGHQIGAELARIVRGEPLAHSEEL
jgi:phosphoglycerate dehydrogenase-like enzyme